MEKTRLALCAVLYSGALVLSSLSAHTETKGNPNAPLQTPKVRDVSESCQPELYEYKIVGSESVDYYARARLDRKHQNGVIEAVILYRHRVLNRTDWENGFKKSVQACADYFERRGP